MNLTKIKEIFSGKSKQSDVKIGGWVRAFRGNKFIELNDGSSLKNIQCVINPEITDIETLKHISVGSSIIISGNIVKSIGSGQKIEISVEEISIIGRSDPEKYPIQPKKHSFEFLREQAHLRIRTATFGSVMRVRSSLAYAIHSFFNEQGFYYVNTPIITSSDAEGAGEMFKVSTLDFENIERNKKKEIDYSKDFFGKKTSLTVSGQLEAETYALGLGNVYTFGPTFRAENSNTSRHLSEFWMIEPEMAFYNLSDNIDLAEKFVKSILNFILKNCQDDLNFLSERLLNEEKTKPQIERSELNLIEKIKFVVKNNFIRVSYSDAFDILKNSNKNKNTWLGLAINKYNPSAGIAPT